MDRAVGHSKYIAWLISWREIVGLVFSVTTSVGNLALKKRET